MALSFIGDILARATFRIVNDVPKLSPKQAFGKLQSPRREVIFLKPFAWPWL